MVGPKAGLPTPAISNPSTIEIRVLRLEHDKGAKGQKIAEKTSGGPNFSAKDEIIGARNVTGAPTNESIGLHERRGQRFSRPALLCHRITIEGGRDRPCLAGMLNRIDNGAAEQRSPVDAGQHHDR
jgi:hypothetical protein